MKRDRVIMLLLLLKITLAVVLILVVQCVDGNQRIVYVSEPFSDDGDTVTNSGDGSSLLCCMHGKCSCQSLDDALDNLTSNVLLNITTDVMLSLLINTSNIENVSMIGHNNPTVNCKGVGGIHFTFCNNCIIQGITWDGCGTVNIDNDTVPGLKLSYFSNITIQNCSFQHSIGQAVVLSDISGDVNINHCKFVNNNHYRGHGAAISYSSNNIINLPPLIFKICNCNFSDNEGAVSLVYIENSMQELNNNINLYDSIFNKNQGVSIYVVNQKLCIHGRNLFVNNTAYYGAGIYISNHSTVIFGKNSDVILIQNSAYSDVGAVYCNGNSFLLDDSTTVFSNNNASVLGGAIYSDVGSTISFVGNSTTEFRNNNANRGGAIYSDDGSTISFEDNTTTVFINNDASGFWGGGAIYSDDGSIILFENSSTTVFSNNNAFHGGAIFSDYGSIISIEDTSITVFSNNNASGKVGGAIYNGDGSTISFKDNSTTELSNNIAYMGGAIGCRDGSTVSFQENSTTVFSNNNASYGGAVYIVYGSTISFEDNSTTVFSNNNAIIGGGIYIDDGSISFECNSTTEFSNNVALRGGAICSYDDSTISFEDNSITVFSNNNAGYDGGAIYSYDCNVLEENSSNSMFSNNTSAKGENIDSFMNNNGIPSNLEFYDPAICIDDDDKKQGCGKYYISHVMLGQYISACVVNYCNYPVGAKKFLINDEKGNGGYTISNLSNLQICGFQGIAIIGYTPLSKPLNYSTNIQLYNEQNSMWKQISVTLIVELSPCYPGFWQYPDSEQCECYHDDDNDIIFCSSNSSTIKRGYWFGNVTDKPTGNTLSNQLL